MRVLCTMILSHQYGRKKNFKTNGENSPYLKTFGNLSTIGNITESFARPVLLSFRFLCLSVFGSGHSGTRASGVSQRSPSRRSQDSSTVRICGSKPTRSNA